MASPTTEPHPLHRLLPRLGTEAEFAAVRSLLASCDFTAEGIAERLGIPAITEFKNIRQGRPRVHSAEQALDAFILLFMDGEYVDRATLEHLLPSGALPALEALGLLACDSARPELCFGTVTLFPARDLLMASDRASAPDNTPFPLAPDAVYPAAMENTTMFLKTLPQLPCDAFLDIGTGTGIAALAASRYARHAWATDIAWRSVRFAEFNRRLNAIENVTVVEGDLYKPVEGLSFDRIVSHPPYVPSKETTLIFRDGGEDGEQIARQIVEGLPHFLRRGGRFYMMLTAADCEGEPFEDRIRGWLGKAQAEFDIVLVSYTLTAPRDLTSNSLAKRNATVNEVLYRLDLWERRKVQFLFYGSVLLYRHSRSGAPLTTRVQKGAAFTPECAEWLLDWQQETHDPAALERILNMRPLLSPDGELGVFHRVREGRFVPEVFSMRCNRPFDSECIVEPWLAQIIAQCDGQRTWRDLLENAKSAGVLDPATSPQEFVQLLEPLVANGLLLLPERPLPMA
jgi:methylase of polypeptide subunit release factors